MTIIAENLYNWDEKGFLIDYASVTHRIMSMEALKNGRIQYAYKDGNREFISLLAYILVNGTTLSLSLIYKGNLGSL